jgi:RNA polymerase sigma factor (sigma-70 family)
MTAEAGPVARGAPVTDLVMRARDGDQQAWDVIVERYAPLVWSICRRYRLVGADADDAGQAVWLQLVDHIGQIRDPAALPGWLATTTGRECGRIVRAARRTCPPGHALDVGDIPDQQATPPDDELLQAERHAALREALAHLPPPCQQLIALLSQEPPAALRPDQRPTGHPGRQHRAHPPPLPGQAAPPPGHCRPGQRRTRKRDIDRPAKP